MAETMLVSGKIISKKLLNNNASIKNCKDYFITLELNKINIPELGIKDYKNNITILTMFPYVSENDKEEYATVHDIVGRNVAVSCSRFGNVYIANQVDDNYKPITYTEKSVIRNELHNFTFFKDKYLAINTITCILVVDSHNPISNVYTCSISNSNLCDATDQNGRVYFRQIPVVFKSGQIKPVLGKEYIVIGSVVNFPHGYHTPKGRHGIYAEIIKEITNESE